MKEAISLIRQSPYLRHQDTRSKIEREIHIITSKRRIGRIIEIPLRAKCFLNTKIVQAKVHSTASTCVAFGLAGWIAWTTADRLYDDRTTLSRDDLSCFSIMRPICDELIVLLFPTDHSKRNKVKKTLAVMEYANSRGCTLNLEGISVLKSIGVALPMVAFLMNVGVDTKNVKVCKQFFYHFILCRQLSDDALDWPEDMKKGQRTLVTEWLEEAIGKDRPFRKYRKAFDKTVSPKVAQKILSHSRSSIGYAKKMTCFTSTEFLEELPRFYKEMAEKILRDYAV